MAKAGHPHPEEKLTSLQQALIDGELSGDAGPLDMQAIANEARRDELLAPPPAL